MAKIKSAKKYTRTQEKFYGMNLLDSTSHEHEASLAKDCIFIEDKPASRYGRRAINSVALNPIVSFAEWSTKFGYKFFVDEDNGAINEDNNIDGTTDAQHTGYSGKKLSSVQLNDQLFRSNGTDSIRWNGTEFVDWFRPGPALRPTITNQSGAGNLNGVYAYRCSYYRYETVFGEEYAYESKPSDWSADTETLVNKKVNIDNLPSLSTVGYWRGVNIYRKGGIYPEWRLIHRYNTTQWAAGGLIGGYEDNVAEPGAVMTSAGNAPPPPMTQLLEIKGRIFGIGDPSHTSRLYFSKPLQPLYWPDINNDLPYYDDIAADDGQRIIGIYHFMDQIFILKDKKVIRWPIINPPYEMAQVLVTNEYGCISMDSIGEIGGNLVWLSDKGLVMFRPSVGDIVEISDQIDTEGAYGIEGIVAPARRKCLIKKFPKSRATLFSFPGSGKSYCYNRGITTALTRVDKTTGEPYVYNVSKWSYNTFDFNCATTPSTASTKIISGSADGYYRWEESTETDDGVDIEMEYHTAWKDFSVKDGHPQLRTTILEYMTDDTNFETTTRFMDGSADAIDFPGVGGGKWGISDWGTGKWAGDGYQKKKEYNTQEMVGAKFRVELKGVNKMILSLTHGLRIRNMGALR